MEVRISDKATGASIGSVSREEFQFLVNQLEEESSTDADYFIDTATIDMLEDNGGSAMLVAILRAAVGESEGIDISWQQT
ncbi:MAG: hypothetical protein A3E01_02415 [Gammaproteobacteria bacterium RIFCSPHIGHO2_12_FULL_63_22]|nr:MAG: hypothetical protein A3E01_02415 [Gammaproteobacteria bacterium RIFCSPHIGHO2_12_FULL_63_22]